MVEWSPSTPSSQADLAGTEVEALREQLSASREENLRLRDLLITKDAELGSLKGQVAALEAGTARLLNVVGRIRALVPGFVFRGLGRLLRRGGAQG